MITKIQGKLVELTDEAATLAIPPMEYEGSSPITRGGICKVK